MLVRVKQDLSGVGFGDLVVDLGIKAVPDNGADVVEDAEGGEGACVLLEQVGHQSFHDREGDKGPLDANYAQLQEIGERNAVAAFLLALNSQHQQKLLEDLDG